MNQWPRTPYFFAGTSAWIEMMNADPPEFPVGDFVSADEFTDEMRRVLTADLADLPGQLRQAVAGLSEAQFDTLYRHWTIRQIVHHIADSHVNSYIRFKWALTEDTPTIKAYHEGLWSALSESRIGTVSPSLQLLDGLHSRWCQLLTTLKPADFDLAFIHPETNAKVTLNTALAYYVWHGKHHLGQILWLRNAYRI